MKSDAAIAPAERLKRCSSICFSAQSDLQEPRFGATRESLRVLQSVSSWLPQTQTWLYDQVRQLPDWIDNHVVCERSVNLDQFALGNIHCFSRMHGPFQIVDKALRKTRLRRYSSYFQRVCERIGPRVVHSHFGNVGWQDRPNVHKAGARHLVTFYGYDVNYLPTADPQWRDRYCELFAAVDSVLCEGPYMATCIANLGCPVEKIRVHHLGVCTEQIAYRPRQWRPGTPLRVLIAAGFTEKKGIPDAIDALGQLRSEVALELTMIGDATCDPRSQAEKVRIMNALNRNGLHGTTRLLGFCTLAVLMREAYAHHIFLSPSVTARDGDTEGGAPVSILHMAASGMPVVTTRHCDIPNILPVGANLADEHDVDALANELHRLVRSPEEWERELIWARRHVEEQFDAHRQADRLADIYSNLVHAGAVEGPTSLRR